MNNDIVIRIVSIIHSKVYLCNLYSKLIHIYKHVIYRTTFNFQKLFSTAKFSFYNFHSDLFVYISMRIFDYPYVFLGIVGSS